MSSWVTARSRRRRARASTSSAPVTILLQTALDLPVAALPALTSTLTGAGPLEDAARALLEDLFGRIRAAITKPGLNAFVEDYYRPGRSVRPPATVPELIAREQRTLAAALRCEATPLSDAETTDVFRTQLSYYPDDLVVTEWNVALVVDDVDYADTDERARASQRPAARAALLRRRARPVHG